ncbi:MAG: hypothetical protein P8182_03285 [Deltaproteobacteria bacterium]
MEILQVLTYASGVVFVVVFAVKLLRYLTMPMHVRWELYPVPHEGKPWGGSFYEEVDHWKKERHKDYFAQYKFMIPEILFIRALYEDNRPMWYWTFPFHMGLYLSIGGLVFLVIGAFLPDPGFVASRKYLASLLTFGTSPQLSALQIINLLLFIGFWAYFPFTHMTHMVSKYFMWDKVKWDDSPNVGDPGMDSKIAKYLAYPVTWSAVHVGAEGGKKSWADVATANPWQEEEMEDK